MRVGIARRGMTTVVTAGALLAALAGCGGSTANVAPEPLEPVGGAAKEREREPSRSEPGGPEAPGVAKDGTRSRKPARVAPRAPSSMAALERSAKLDSRLKRDVERWDAAVERGLRAQADAQATGIEAMRALRADLLKRVKGPDASLVDLYLAGRVHGKLGEVDRARTFFERALKKNANFLYGYEGLALCAGQSGDEDALQTVENELAKAFDIWPEFPRGWLILGQTRLTRFDPNGALEHFARIPRAHPVYTEGLINICKCHLLMDEPERAVVKLTDALERDRENLFYREMLGRALLDTGKTDDAEAAFRFVHERAPERPLSLLGLAKVDELRGRRREAFERYRAVAENRDHTQDVRRDALAGIARLSGRREAPSAQALLHQLKSSPSPEKRRAAAAVLWTVDGEILVRAFLERVNVKYEPDEGVRVYAVKALARQALGRCIDVFRHLLDPAREPSRLVRGAAAHALARIKIEYAPLSALVKALADPEPYVFRQARLSLEAISQERLRMDLAGDLSDAERRQVAEAWRAWLAARAEKEDVSGERTGRKD